MTENPPESLLNEDGEVPVQGFLHRAAGDSRASLVLTHGAGGNYNAPLLVAVAELFAAAGVTTLRCNLPFRQRRPTGPPSRSDAKNDQAGLRRAVELMRGEVSGPAFLGGVSYGGRQASMLVADQPSLVNGLFLLSYPLHPPGRSAQLRTAHFPQIQTRTLFVSGTRDAFASIDELQSVVKLIPAPTKVVAIEGAAHALLQKSNRTTLPTTLWEEFSTVFQLSASRLG